MSALAYDVLGSDEAGTERWSGTGPWCWISTTARYRLFWMLVTGKGWEIACYLITMSSYVLLKIYLVRKFSDCHNFKITFMYDFLTEKKIKQK